MPRKVLVIDDSSSWREALCQLLDESGLFTVAGQAGAASEALDLAALADTAIVDVNLDGEDGWDLAGMLSARHGLDVVMMTAEDDADGLAADSATVGVLHKWEDPVGLPVRLAALLEAGAGPSRSGQVDRRLSERRTGERRESEAGDPCALLGESVHDGPLQVVLAAQALAARHAESSGDAAWTEQARLLALAGAQLRILATGRVVPLERGVAGLGVVPGGLPVDARVDEAAWARLSRVQQQAVRAFAHEAGANSARHSCGTRVSVVLAEQGDVAVLRVTDDGHCSQVPAERAGHLGMRLQRERAERAGGVAAWRIGAHGSLVCELAVPLPSR